MGVGVAAGPHCHSPLLPGIRAGYLSSALLFAFARGLAWRKPVRAAAGLAVRLPPGRPLAPAGCDRCGPVPVLAPGARLLAQGLPLAPAPAGVTFALVHCRPVRAGAAPGWARILFARGRLPDGHPALFVPAPHPGKARISPV